MTCLWIVFTVPQISYCDHMEGIPMGKSNVTRVCVGPPGSKPPPPRGSGTQTATMSVAWFTCTVDMSSAHMFQGGEHKYQISSAIVFLVTHMIWCSGWKISMPNWIFSHMQYDMFLAAVTAIVFVGSIIMHEMYSFNKWWVLCCKVLSNTVHFRYNAVQFMARLYTALPWQQQNLNHSLNSQPPPPPPPPHTLPSRATYGVSLCDFQQNLRRYHGKALYDGYIKMSPMNSYQ